MSSLWISLLADLSLHSIDCKRISKAGLQRGLRRRFRVYVTACVGYEVFHFRDVVEWKWLFANCYMGKIQNDHRFFRHASRARLM